MGTRETDNIWHSSSLCCSNQQDCLTFLGKWPISIKIQPSSGRPSPPPLRHPEHGPASPWEREDMWKVNSRGGILSLCLAFLKKSPPSALLLSLQWNMFSMFILCHDYISASCKAVAYQRHVSPSPLPTLVSVMSHSIKSQLPCLHGLIPCQHLHHLARIAPSIPVTSGSSCLDWIPTFPQSSVWFHLKCTLHPTPHSDLHLLSKNSFRGLDHKAKPAFANSITRHPGIKAVG